MAKRIRATNVFYVILLVISTLFVITALAYLISPMILSDARAVAGKEPRGTARLADWLDQRGPWLLGVEFVVMLVMATAAMLTDDWFQARAEREAAATRASER